MDFWHYYFAPSSAPWFTGNIWGNIFASITCWFVGYVLLIRRHVECRWPGCYRIGKVPVKNTHYRTCPKHASPSRHAKLKHDHHQKHPEMAKLWQDEYER